MEKDKRYNGWTNYETWCVNLWLTNEESSYNYWRDSARHFFKRADLKRPKYFTQSEQARLSLAESLKQQLGDARPELGASMWADLLGAAFSEVDWSEIANAFLEEEEGYEVTVDGPAAD